MEMSGFEAQARILHQSNQIRDEVKSLHSWEQDMKSMEMKRKAVPDAEVSSFFVHYRFSLWIVAFEELLCFRHSITVFHCGIRCKHQNRHHHRHRCRRRQHHRSIVNRQLVAQPINCRPPMCQRENQQQPHRMQWKRQMSSRHVATIALKMVNTKRR